MSEANPLYMRRCIQLAMNGFHNAPPNPMVGAVVVYDDRIIGEGYHVRCGEGHAEVNALASVKPEDEHLLTESTIYVSLEPCSHYGKTPPCADLIISKGLKHCVVGCIDPFAKVSGRGIAKLREAGIEVTVGVMEEECRRLNKRFITYHQLHRPFITLKWAQTQDGFMAYENQKPDHILAVSDSFTQTICHKRRAEHQAILVGANTLITDNPSLTTRKWSGEDPLPCVLISEKSLNNLKAGKGDDYRLLQPDFNTLFADSIDSLLKMLYDKGIQSLLVEGGQQTLQSFIDRDLWDEAFIETGDFTIGKGLKAPILNNAVTSTNHYSSHRIDFYSNLHL